MVVILIGGEEKHEFSLLREEIQDRGSEVVVLDLDEWPSDKPLTQNVGENAIQIGSKTIPMEDVEGAFARPNTLFVPAVEDKVNNCVSDDENPYAALTQLREYRGLFESVLQSLEYHGATVVPKVEALVWEEMNPHGCDLFDSMGIDIPETVATNDSETAKQFLESHGKVVYKPIAGVGGAHVMTDDDAEELEGLTTPVLFQEFVPGDDVRAYVVNGEFAGAFRYGYDGESFSFKWATGEIDAEAVELPASAKRDVLEAVEASPTNYASIDLRLRDDRSYSFIEVNAGGRFVLSDSRGITNVSDALATYLVD